jgi:predicted nucleotidyltransferase
MHFDVDNHTLFLAVTGSHAYGMAREGSDVDIRGACLPPQEVRESPFKQFEQFYPKSQSGPWGPGPSTKAIETLLLHPTAGASYRHFDTALDLCIYSLHKFVFLAANNNPNVLELLFLDERDVLFADDRWRRISEHRDLFLSRKCKHTYLGYAHAQLKRILTHRDWLLHPPKKEPTRGDFGLPEETVLPADVRNLIDENVKKIVRDWTVSDGFEDILTGAFLDSLHDRMREFQATLLACTEDLLDDKLYELGATSLGLSKEVLYAIKQERKYRGARKHWEQHQRWKRDRNPARAALEEKHGFDTKHGAHLVRLMRTGLEIVRDGKLIVRRPDAEELLAIRDGAFDYETLMVEVNRLKAAVESAVETSPLPRSPDFDKIEQVLLSVL